MAGAGGQADEMWLHGGEQFDLGIAHKGSAAKMLHANLAMLAIRAGIDDELLRYTWRWTDPESGEQISGRARIRIHVERDTPGPPSA